MAYSILCDITFGSDDRSNTSGHGSHQIFKLPHLDSQPGVGDQFLEFYEADGTAASDTSLEDIPYFFNNV